MPESSVEGERFGCGEIKTHSAEKMVLEAQPCQRERFRLKQLGIVKRVEKNMKQSVQRQILISSIISTVKHVGNFLSPCCTSSISVSFPLVSE